MSNYV